MIMMSRTGVEGPQAVIVSAARTPIGRAGKGRSPRSVLMILRPE